jgi:hypothetical protein
VSQGHNEERHSILHLAFDGGFDVADMQAETIEYELASLYHEFSHAASQDPSAHGDQCDDPENLSCDIEEALYSGRYFRVNAEGDIVPDRGMVVRSETLTSRERATRG